MNTPSIRIDVRGLAEASGQLQTLRKGLADRRPLHATLAVEAQNFTRDYVARSSRHATAQRLGAAPTGFRQRSATRIEGASDADAAIIRIPRNTGLGRAFSDITLRPGSGRKYLTIPAAAETYGKAVRDFPQESFAFTVAGGRYPALVWREAGGTHAAGAVAYWLRREVQQKQDRTLLPTDAAYQELGRKRAQLYIASLIYRAA